jgi:hypothetical protein
VNNASYYEGLVMKAVIVKTSGEVFEVNAEGLQEIQRAVGGYIEAIEAGSIGSGFVNEEGKIKGLPDNIIATAVWHRANKLTKFSDYLVGDVLFCGLPDDEGNSQDISQEFSEFIENISSTFLKELGEIFKRHENLTH